MRSAIYGAGTLGTVIGAFITRNGGQVDLINHNTEHISALQKNGARIVGTEEFTQQVTAFTPDKMHGTYDIIFLITKQFHNVEVALMLKSFLSPDGVLVTLQNGMPELALSEVIGEEKVLGCIAAFGATMLKPGVCELTSSPDSLTFVLGTIKNGKKSKTVQENIQKVKSILELMGPVRVDDNFIGTRWNKLLINSSFSGMSTVCGQTFGEVSQNKASRKIIQAIIKECIDVCKKADIKIEPLQNKHFIKMMDYGNTFKKSISFIFIPSAIKKHSLLKASMLQDLEHGKKTEVDSLNGIVCECGRRYGVPTPMNDKVLEIIHKEEEGKLIPSIANLALFI